MLTAVLKNMKHKPVQNKMNIKRILHYINGMKREMFVLDHNSSAFYRLK